MSNPNRNLVVPKKAHPRDEDRAKAKAYGDVHGGSWLPRALGAESRSGVTGRGDEGPPCLQSPSSGHGACCAKVSDEADAEACRRLHRTREDEGGEP